MLNIKERSGHQDQTLELLVGSMLRITRLDEPPALVCFDWIHEFTGPRPERPNLISSCPKNSLLLPEIRYVLA